MQLTQALKDKLSSECTSVEGAMVLLSIALTTSYQSITTTEGLDSDGNDVEAFASETTYLPVAQSTGSRVENVVVRMSCRIDKAHQYSAKKWQLVTPIGSPSDTPSSSLISA